MDDVDFIWLNDIESADHNLVGEVSKSLSKLKKNELEIQNFFVISSKSFMDFVSEHSSEILSLLNRINLSDIDSLSFASKQIQKIIDAYQFSETFSIRLLENYRLLEDYDSKYSMLSMKAKELIHSGRDLPTVTLRVSMNKHICSYESKINLLGISSVLSELRSIWKEIFSMKSLYIIKSKRISVSDILPAVIVQKTLLPSKSGDIFTSNPLNSNNLQMFIQSHWGLNNDFIETASEFIIDKTSDSLVSSKVNPQYEFLTKKSPNSEAYSQEIPADYQRISPLSNNEVRLLSQLGQKIESVFDFPQHINWIVFNKKLIITKVEPITNIFRQPVLSSQEESAVDFVLKATPINNSTSSGIFYKNFVYDKKAIFQVNEARSSFIPYLILSSGVISRSNSLSSFLAVSCQDLGLPCLINAPQSFSLNEGQKIKISGPYVMIDNDAYINSQSRFVQKQEYSQQYPSSSPKPFAFESQPPAQEYSRQESYSFSPERESASPEPEFSPNAGSYESPSQDESYSEPGQKAQESAPEYSLSQEPEPAGASSESIYKSVIGLESQINDLVLKNAEKRRSQQLSPREENEARILSEAEWIIRDLKKKLSKLVEQPDNSYA